MKTLNFTKMVASGNDFVVIDNRKSYLRNIKLSTFARQLCDRKFGIGADGLLLLEKSRRADFKMRVFNPDGSEASMCGNGLRCIALYANKKKTIRKKYMRIETKAGVLSAQITNNDIRVSMIRPKNIMLDLNLEVHRKPYQVSFINTGVPHVVYFTKDLNSISVQRLGAGIRYHKVFEPAGTNVNFVKVLDKKNIRIRTYERGVEQETLACGTGATASAIIFGIRENITSPINVHTKGGEILKIYFKILKEDKVTDVYLEGRANFVFGGRIKEDV